MRKSCREVERAREKSNQVTVERDGIRLCVEKGGLG